MPEFALADRPFYRERLGATGVVTPWALEDLSEWVAATGDPYGGRRAGGELPELSLQLEASDPPVWVGLSSTELWSWSVALERLLARWGVSAGDTLGFFEFGSSPLVLLSAGSYLPRLERGATDRLGADLFCNDGLGSMATRMAEAIRLVEPSALVLRADVAAPLTEAVELAGISLADAVRWAALTVPEGAPFPGDVARWSERWGLPIRSVLRADAAFLLAGDCASCGLFHIDGELYDLEPLPGGDVAVTTRFAASTPAVRYSLGPGEAVAAGCPDDPAAPRLRWGF